jgi:Spy/CpxP family protein refolding chaperone
LTGADQPAAEKIDAKVREIENLRTDQRLAFIRAVGEAAQVLTDDQRKMLLGQLPPAPSSMPQEAPSMGAGMKDM